MAYHLGIRCNESRANHKNSSIKKGNMTQDNQVIKIGLTPEQVTNSLPINFIENAGSGFSDKILGIPAAIEVDNIEDAVVKYEISFDGEGELLATVLSKPDAVSADQTVELITEFFLSDESDEDEEEEEEEEVEA